MKVGSVHGLYRYAVKSMAGEQLQSVHLGPGGIPGDRAWAVRDEEKGGIRGGKRFAELMACAAHYENPPAETGSSPAVITLPDGSTVATGAKDVSSRLSHVIGSPVTLWPLMPKEALDHYRRGAPMLDDMEAELRRMFARLPDEPLPDVSVFPPELVEFESPPGTYFDAFPLLLMTRQSLDYLSHCAPEQVWDVRRFRPNFLLDASVGGDLPETAWEGKKLRLGQAVLQLEVMCPRCIMTTHGFGDVPRDPGVMRSLVQNSDGSLGIYASVIEPGEVAAGDEATMID